MPPPPPPPQPPAQRIPKAEWHWLCRVKGHRYTRDSLTHYKWSETCTRCGFDPRGQIKRGLLG